MEVSYNTHFPHLHNNFNVHSFIREQFVFFYFNLTRKNDIFSDTSRNFYDKFVNVLQIIKKNIHEKNDLSLFYHYLKLFYKLIPYTRDIYSGKGERDLSYLLILALYQVYPSLALFAIHNIIVIDHSTGNTKIKPYGSWKDIQYLCDFIYNFTDMKYKNDNSHAIIDYCVEIMTNQLIQDFKTWNFSNNPHNINYISNVAAWIPRENKKFSWLFDKLSYSWTLKTHPHIFKFAEFYDSKEKAIRKSKRLFRKQFSYLNKQLNTIEINLSKKKYDNIGICEIKKDSFTKYFDLYFKNIQHFHNINNNCYKKYKGSLTPFSFLIKKTIELDDYKDDISFTSKKLYINNTWKQYIKLFSLHSMHYTIPIIDVSFFMQQNNMDAFYSAIGTSIIIASYTKIENRVIAMSNQPIWIKWNKDDLFTDIIHNFMNSIFPVQNTANDIYSSIQYIIEGIRGSHSSQNFTDNLNIVILSDFINNSHLVDIQQIFFDNNFTVSPFIFYWNFSTTYIIDNLLVDNKKIRHLSGYSIYTIYDLIDIINKQKSTTFTSFSCAANSIDKERYVLFSHYISKFIS